MISEYTKRILQLMIDGHTQKEISAKLNTTKTNTNNHVAYAKKLTGARTTIHLAMIAQNNGLVNNPKDLRDCMKQNWTIFKNGFSDQFGFEIMKGEKYSLYWKGVFVAETETLLAAKEISLILINDRI
jgi:DNA-binding CsgD family transcriptional regulator